MKHITSVEQLKAGEYYALRKKNQTRLGAIYMCRKSEEKNDAYVGDHWAEELFMTCEVVGPIPHPDFDAIIRGEPEETVQSLQGKVQMLSRLLEEHLTRWEEPDDAWDEEDWVERSWFALGGIETKTPCVEDFESLLTQRNEATSHLKVILQWIKEPASGMDEGMLMGEQLEEALAFIAKAQGGGE